MYIVSDEVVITVESIYLVVFLGEPAALPARSFRGYRVHVALGGLVKQEKGSWHPYRKTEGACMGAVISFLSAQYLISPCSWGSRIAGQVPKQQCPFLNSYSFEAICLLGLCLQNRGVVVVVVVVERLLLMIMLVCSMYR